MRENLHKTAFFQGALGAARKFAPELLSKARAAAPAVTAAASKHTAGMGKEMLHQGLMGAGLMGTLEGGLGAATAAPGERQEAALKGFGHGALTGGAMGAMTGAVTNVGRNLRSAKLNEMAQNGAGGFHPFPHDLAGQTLNKGYLGTLKDVVTGKGPLGRSGAAFEAAAAPAQFAAEWALPSAGLALGEHVLGGGEKEAPKTAGARLEDHESYIEPMLGQGVGGLVGGGGMEAVLMHALDPLQLEHLNPSSSVIRSKVLPGLAALGGSYAGYKAVKAHNRALGDTIAEAKPAIDTSDLDLDVLHRYFGKDTGLVPTSLTPTEAS